jgi:hypothetical protein
LFHRPIFCPATHTKNDDNDKDDDDENGKDDEVLTLIAKFRVRDLMDVPAGKKVKLILTGNLLDGTKVEGSDTVRVIYKYHK